MRELAHIQMRDPMRDELARAQAEFLARGGQIEVLPVLAGVAPKPPAHIEANRIRGCDRRRLEVADHKLADRARAMAGLGVTGDKIRHALKMKQTPFDQLIARHGIKLPVVVSPYARSQQEI